MKLETCGHLRHLCWHGERFVSQVHSLNMGEVSFFFLLPWVLLLCFWNLFNKPFRSRVRTIYAYMPKQRFYQPRGKSEGCFLMTVGYLPTRLKEKTSWDANIWLTVISFPVQVSLLVENSVISPFLHWWSFLIHISHLSILFNSYSTWHCAVLSSISYITWHWD